MSAVAYTFAYTFARIAFARAVAFGRRTSHFALHPAPVALRPSPCTRRPPLSVLQMSELASAAARSLALAISKR